jgi:hypothetical protein
MKINLSLFNRAQKYFAAIVHMTHCSQEAGNALAELRLQKNTDVK